MANKVLFVLNCGGNRDVLRTYMDEAPETPKGQTCFGMIEPTDRYGGNWNSIDDIVIFNETYAGYKSTVPSAQRNCLRRAWKVDVGNEELARDDSSNRHPATKAMRDKSINFLAYDDIKNAFAMDL